MTAITKMQITRMAPPLLMALLFLSSLSGNHLIAGHHDYFTDIEGWEKPEEIDVYKPETLWDIINGAADVFMAYDFQEL